MNAYSIENNRLLIELAQGGDKSESEAATSMELLDRLIASVDLKVLYCTPTEEAARVAFEGLVGN